jgi:hypothetical protein
MPTILFIPLSKGRIKGTDEVAKGLIVHAFHAPLFGTGEDPRVLFSIPEQ